jgi:prepilin-type N-terminal cleavage/methylation domain-containing protein
MPSHALTRRDPPLGKNGFSDVRGLTLIELLVVLAVLAIITTLAVPSYRALIEKRQVTSSAQQLAAFLSSAQLESVKRNENVAVDYFHNGDADAPAWCMGIEVVGNQINPVDCDCSDDPASCTLDGTPRYMTQDTLGRGDAVVAVEGDGAFVIDPTRGMMVNFTDGMTFQLLSQPEHQYALNVVVGPTGRVSICSDTDRAEKEVTGYDGC